jgi:hypothetical protein
MGLEKAIRKSTLALSKIGKAISVITYVFKNVFDN